MSKRIEDALVVLKQLGLPRAQINDRSAFTLLALLSLDKKRQLGKQQKSTPWSDANYGVGG